jgi:hypothetical protein
MPEDDRIQGILFSKTALIDLTKQSRQQRFIDSVSAVKKSLQSWTPHLRHPASKGRAEGTKNDPTTTALLERLKPRD